MPNMDLLVRVSDLAALRRVAAEKRQALAEKRATFDAEHAVEIDVATRAAEAVHHAEVAVRAIADAEYAKTKETALCPGVGVRMLTVLNYTPADAFAWGKKAETAIIPEQLDVKAFEKAAKALKLSFVTYDTVPQITIASDLDKALSSVEAAADASQVTV